ncbi:CoA ester lyase [Gryllotalpicola koreensis]|uniref:CoA ester lyase n=1 Tax=Gryllotalpicola koreensis TaxID=993086 RepID=A0ABP8A036_9MICO
MSAQPVTALYVPGDRPDRFDKAVASGADLVILDLEDAVAAESKSSALASVVSWLTGRKGASSPLIQVRVNPGATHEVQQLRATGARLELRIPKVDTAADVEWAVAVWPEAELTAIIESAHGLQQMEAVAQHPRVTRLALGESDLASDLGTRDNAVLDHLRIRLLIAARAAGLPAPMLSAYPYLHDPDGLRADTERGRALGWFGRAAVHPRQLEVIRSVFAPSEEDESWARAVLAAIERGGVSTLPNGEMVDPAMAGRARRILGNP